MLIAAFCAKHGPDAWTPLRPELQTQLQHHHRLRDTTNVQVRVSLEVLLATIKAQQLEAVKEQIQAQIAASLKLKAHALVSHAAPSLSNRHPAACHARHHRRGHAQAGAYLLWRAQASHAYDLTLVGPSGRRTQCAAG
jgi:hypothetical protein